MLIYNAKQLLTLAGGPQRGRHLGDLGLIPEGAVLIRDGLVQAVGPMDDLLERFPREERFNAAGKVVMPGFVDPHTHLIFMGNRALEFEMRLEGKSYQEIMAAGVNLKVIAVPGHSPGGIALWSEADGVVFTGDALFAGSVGRSDLPGGDPEQLIENIREQLFTMPPETVVYPGHGPETTIRQELETNPFFS